MWPGLSLPRWVMDMGSLTGSLRSKYIVIFFKSPKFVPVYSPRFSMYMFLHNMVVVYALLSALYYLPEEQDHRWNLRTFSRWNCDFIWTNLHLHHCSWNHANATQKVKIPSHWDFSNIKAGINLFKYHVISGQETSEGLHSCCKDIPWNHRALLIAHTHLQHFCLAVHKVQTFSLLKINIGWISWPAAHSFDK